MNSKYNTKVGKVSRKVPMKRTPRTLMADKNENKNLPAIISETFSGGNFDLVGKIDDMRALTKELSIMARQLEQWVGIAHTIMLAFKDNGVLKDVVRALSTVGSGEGGKGDSVNSRQKERKPVPPPFPFSLPFRRTEEENIQDEKEPKKKVNKGSGDNPTDGLNILEVFNNPAFQEIMSKLFLHKK